MSSGETLRPSSEEFVLLIPPGDEATLTRARRLGPVERMPAQRGYCLLRVPQQATPAASWAAATQTLGGNVALFPVLYDRDGASHYPTGEVTVRFDAAPDDASLARFCEAHRLKLLRRNAFVAQQVVCTPASAAAVFLPDLVARIAEAPGVVRAWANTLSAYRRTGK
jgi:hypothetical protein